MVSSWENASFKFFESWYRQQNYTNFVHLSLRQTVCQSFINFDCEYGLFPKFWNLIQSFILSLGWYIFFAAGVVPNTQLSCENFFWIEQNHIAIFSVVSSCETFLFHVLWFLCWQRNLLFLSLITSFNLVFNFFAIMNCSSFSWSLCICVI